VLIVAGMIQGRDGRSTPRQPTRHPWWRSMREEPYRPGTGKLTPVEAVFVGTAIVASIAMLYLVLRPLDSALPSSRLTDRVSRRARCPQISERNSSATF
jgi:hypothetical protein